MNSYSLGSDSGRWWWPQAAAGAVGTAAVAAILIAPTAGHAIPVDDTRRAPATGLGDHSIVEPGAGPGHPCFLIRRWNTALDGPVPVCGLPASPASPERSGAIRPWLDDRW